MFLVWRGSGRKPRAHALLRWRGPGGRALNGVIRVEARAHGAAAGSGYPPSPAPSYFLVLMVLHLFCFVLFGSILFGFPWLCCAVFFCSPFSSLRCCFRAPSLVLQAPSRLFFHVSFGEFTNSSSIFLLFCICFVFVAFSFRSSLQHRVLGPLSPVYASRQFVQEL